MLFSKAQAAQLSQLRTVPLLFKGKRAPQRWFAQGLNCQAPNRHGCRVETCCENTDESLRCCCLSKLFCQLLRRGPCLLKDRILHLSIYFRAEIYIQLWIYIIFKYILYIVCYIYKHIYSMLFIQIYTVFKCRLIIQIYIIFNFVCTHTCMHIIMCI